MKEQLSEIRKDVFLMDLLNAERMPNPDEWKIVYQCALDNNSLYRSDAVEILGIRCNEMDEELLRKLSQDKADDLVRVCALQSLQMGREEKTLKCLYERMRTGGWMVRGYAVCAFFDVWVNRNGYTKDSIRKCWRKAEKLYKKEKDPWVLSAYEEVRYLCGYEDGLEKMKKILCEGQGNEYVQGITFGQFTYLRNIYNESKINQMIKDSIEYMRDFPWRQKEAQDFLEEKEIPMVLIIDQENAGLSQILTYLSGEIENEIWVESAGLKPAEMTKAEVADALKAGSDTINSFYYPKRVRKIYNYHYLVPLGIRLNPQKYPFHTIIPIFEDVDENILDVGMAEKMLEELRNYINAYG